MPAMPAQTAGEGDGRRCARQRQREKTSADFGFCHSKEVSGRAMFAGPKSRAWIAGGFSTDARPRPGTEPERSDGVRQGFCARPRTEKTLDGTDSVDRRPGAYHQKRMDNASKTAAVASCATGLDDDIAERLLGRSFK